MLRDSDMSPINFKRVAQADGKEVPWENIVKGYEYEKGKFIVLKDEDFARVDIEATQTVDIITFVKLEEVNPVYFFKPYYMQVEKGGDKAYVLLRQTLEEENKVAIAKVIIKTKQHLAAIKANNEGLTLELMHFPDEIVDIAELQEPKINRNIAKPELAMAKKLVANMSSKFDPKMFKDDYHEMLEKIIDQKVRKGGKEIPAAKHAKKPEKYIDLVEVLQRSIENTKKRSGSGKKRAAA